MRLTPPKKIVFCISVLAMMVGLVMFLFLDDMKDLGYWATFGGGLLLTLSVSMKGLQPSTSRMRPDDVGAHPRPVGLRA